MPSECPSSAQWPSSAIWVKKAISITGSELLNSFIGFFKNLSKCIFYITRIVDCFLRNKMCKFCHVLQARYKSLRNVSKTLYKYFLKFQKIKYERPHTSLQLYYCSSRITQLHWYFRWLFSIDWFLLHEDKKYFTSLRQLWKDHFWQKQVIWKGWDYITYLTMPESLRSENFIYKAIIWCFFLLYFSSKKWNKSLK